MQQPSEVQDPPMLKQLPVQATGHEMADNEILNSQVAVQSNTQAGVPQTNVPNVENAAGGAVVENAPTEYVNPRKRSKKTSGVWAHFDEIVTKDKTIVEAVCKYCKGLYSSASKNGTTHLWRHFYKCPNRCNQDIKQYLVSDPEIGGAGALKTYKFDLGELRKFIALFIVEGSHSFSLVEERGFRRMMLRATPHFNAFSRHTLKRELMTLYKAEKDTIQHMILNAKSRICFTTDNWRNEHTREEYICITTHFVDSEWKLQKRILRFRALTPPYDGGDSSSDDGSYIEEVDCLDDLFQC